MRTSFSASYPSPIYQRRSKTPSLSRDSLTSPISGWTASALYKMMYRTGKNKQRRCATSTKGATSRFRHLEPREEPTAYFSHARASPANETPTQQTQKTKEKKTKHILADLLTRDLKGVCPSRLS